MADESENKPKIQSQNLSMEELLDRLNNSNWRIRDEAANALAAIGKPAVEVLLARLGDGSPEIRSSVTEALAKIKNR
jgi:HEAT repeat protein